MKILLILSAPPDDPLRDHEPFMPLSLPLLAATAPGHDYHMVDMLRSGAQVDDGEPVDLVGISVRMRAETFAYEIADRFRARGVPVVLGGPQVSAVPHRAIEHADAVAVGEGEPLWPVIVDDVERGRLRDFYVATPGPFDARGRSVYQVGDWYDLGLLPRPRRDLMTGSYRFDTVFAARGCPIDCDFCGVPGMFGHHTRRRPVEDVVAEIDGLERMFYLIDDTVFGRPGTYDYYLELYHRISRLAQRRLWTGQGHLGAVDSVEGRDVIRAAVRSGLLYVAVGMESINAATLRRSGAASKAGRANDAAPAEHMKEQIRFLQSLGLFVSGWFTIGYEDDTIETYYETQEFCRETGILPVLSPVNALPGTRLLDRLRREGKLDWSYTLTNWPHPRMQKHEIIEALDCTVERGFALGARIKRSLQLGHRLELRYGNTFHDRIYATIWALVLQAEMRRIMVDENRYLAGPVSQNAFGD
jgi:radical SAM superfamily enzyme YgiQ (UPF0313 family)